MAGHVHIALAVGDDVPSLYKAAIGLLHPEESPQPVILCQEHAVAPADGVGEVKGVVGVDIAVKGKVRDGGSPPRRGCLAYQQ
jgi:hypothetical protein